MKSKGPELTFSPSWPVAKLERIAFDVSADYKLARREMGQDLSPVDSAVLRRIKRAPALGHLLGARRIRLNRAGGVKRLVHSQFV